MTSFLVFNKCLMRLMMSNRTKKKQNEVVILFDDILDHGNPFKNIETNDIYIEDGLFDNNDSQDIKNISGVVTETIVLSGDIEIPSNNELATDAPEKTNIISTYPNRTRIESRRILKKYQKQQQKGNLKKQINQQVNG